MAKRWALLLGGNKASAEQQVDLVGPRTADAEQAKGVPGVSVLTAQQWPSKEQFEKADVIVAYCYLAWTPERLKELREYLEKGGGLVVIHSATWTKPKPSSDVADLLGVGGFTSWRHITVKLEVQAPDHPICHGMPRLVTLPKDEAYWPPTPIRKNVVVLASAVGLQNEPLPLIWCYQIGKGRVLGCVPGHSVQSFDDPFFRAFLLRGLVWAAGDFPYRFDDLILRGTKFQNTGR